MEDRGLRMRGAGVSTVEKFFGTEVSTVLFPVFIDARLVAGMLEVGLAPRLVAEEIMVDGHTADHSSLNEAQGARQDIGGYYRPDFERTSVAMRPSATLNGIIDGIAAAPAAR